MTAPVESVPSSSPLVGPDGRSVNTPWFSFFVSIFNALGGAGGSASALLDTLSSIPGSMLLRGVASWAGLLPGAHNAVLRMGVTYPEWDTLDGNSFAPQAQNRLFAGPAAGAAAAPGFRALVSADLNGVAGQIPGTLTNDNAAAGDIGEYVASQVVSGAAVALGSGVPADVTHITLSAGDWDVWGSISTLPAGTTTQSDIRGWINTVSATDPLAPNNGAYSEWQSAIGAGLGQTTPIGMQRISVANGVNQAVYLSATVTFATSTLGAFGFIGARRVR
ncbi:MAG: hypothetical protein P4L76_17710 [Beijerinckiaceae bacterium]|nr:hypothetical protein [Beijerinckiaceae bacterium]